MKKALTFACLIAMFTALFGCQHEGPGRLMQITKEINTGRMLMVQNGVRGEALKAWFKKTWDTMADLESQAYYDRYRNPDVTTLTEEEIRVLGDFRSLTNDVNRLLEKCRAERKLMQIDFDELTEYRDSKLGK